MGKKSKGGKRDERLIQYFAEGGWDAPLRAAACIDATVCKMELIGFDEEEFCVEHGFDEGIDRQCIVLGSQISVEDQHA